VVDGLAQLAAAVRGMHASEARLRAVFACSPIGMALLDADGRVVETNAALARFLGRDEDALAGSRLGELAHPDETEPFAAGRLERRFVHADGQVVWAATSIVDLPDDDGVGGTRLVCVDDVTTRRRTERLLLHAALHDSLTNLPNRRLLRDRLDTALARAGRSANTVAVLFIDLDDFKHVNDSMGHEVGDELLVAVARNIASVLRTCDTVARLGGDEFVVVCEDVAGEGDISRLARRVLDAIRRPVQLRDRCVSTTASIGVAVPSAAGESTDELIRLADLAMYRAKRQGDGPDRADFVLADDSLRSLAAPGTELAAELRHAIQADQLRLHYQPVVTWSGRLLGLEALLRWPHPSRGLLLPSEFLHAAEGTDLAQPLSDWVLRTAIVDAASWRAAGLRVSVNMWAGEIARPGFAENVAALLTWAGLPARSLYLEVHEHDLADAGPALADELAQLRRLGVGLAVDAFGSGGASLADLKRLPGDTVKIDRAFVAAVCDDPADAAIVRAIADTARATGRHPVAAGVETAAQLNRLRELGCTTVQGYLTGRPTPLVDLREVIRDRRVRLP
jgi:diguanylate cyclase (GGDEF)-like protein/PAS domain S-box-containing protein